MKYPLALVTGFFALLFSLSTLAQSPWQYISPMPSSKWINPEQKLAFRMGEPIAEKTVDASLLQLEGSISGQIICSAEISSDKRTVIFSPEKPFAYGETVQVTLHAGINTLQGHSSAKTTFSFQIKHQENLSLLAKYYQEEDAQNTPFVQDIPITASTGKSVAQLITYGNYTLPERYMQPTITTLNNPEPGYTLANPRPRGNIPYDPYNVMLDKYGEPIFFLEWNTVCNLFQKTYNDQLLFCSFSNTNPSLNRWYVLNNQYQFVDTLTMGNGYQIDQHGIAMMENGNHLLIAYDPQLVGMDTVFPGGNPNATVIGLIIQELDADHNVVFQWRSWDYFNILDGTHIDFTSANIDYVHGNSIGLTNDDQIIISCRGMDEVTKIDRSTGEIIWRFGLHAINNMFTFTNDTIGFYKQHDARQLDNGNVTVYDNGNFHSPQFSQGIEYEIDEANFTASLTWNYQHEPSIYASATGSNHRQTNGNSLICWGLTWPIAFTEVDENNEVQWELSYPDSIWNYQAFRQTWTTGLFTTSVDTVDYGYYDDYIPWPFIVTVTNHADHEITINSASNHSNAFSLQTQLPQTLQSNETKNFIISFFPDGVGPENFEDVMTLNYDSYFSDTLSQRIARQIVLKGTTIDPSNIDNRRDEQIQVYPNPSPDIIEITSLTTTIESVSLRNLLGETIQQFQPFARNIRLDLSGLPKGLYFVQIKIQQDDQPIVKKVIKR